MCIRDRFGGAGGDFIYGGNGADVIYGGLGADILNGGDDEDTFVYTSAAESNGPVLVSADLISAFDEDEDMVDLSAIDADDNTTGDQAFTVVTAFTGTSGELVISVTGASTWTIFGDTNGDGIADLTIGGTGEIIAAGNIVL